MSRGLEQSRRGGLAGRRVVNTRAATQAVALDLLIAERGGIALSYPCIAIEEPADTAPLDAAVHAAAAGRFDLVVFTSANTVAALAASLLRLGLQNDALLACGVRAAAVGPRTAAAAAEMLGLRPEVVPATYTGSELGRAIAAAADRLSVATGSAVGDTRTVASGPAAAVAGPARGRLLLPQSNIAPTYLAELLSTQGWEVVRPIAYITTAGVGGVDLPRLLDERAIDAIALTSPSTAVNLLRRLGSTLGGPQPALDALGGVCVACIGPQTVQAAEGLGLRVEVRPDEHTLAALVAALDSRLEPIAAQPTLAAVRARVESPDESCADSAARSHSGPPHAQEIP